MSARLVTIDANEAAASVSYRTNEVIAIYPITPASPMGEWADAWAAEGKKNVYGAVPSVIEMQSEGGAAGAVHGALQTGALSTTYTASQGLLLMIPNMYKIAGELLPAVIHVAARTVATHALSIFGDHSDVMAVRQTGFAMLASSTVQEAHDMALVVQAATLRARVPFVHFFDGFRTSHEIRKIRELSDADILAMIDDATVAAHRERALSPDHPVLRGSAQNPDVFFQAREAQNPFHDAVAGIVEDTLDRFAGVAGRRYGLFEYTGAPNAERVIVVMGSGAETAAAAARALVARDERVGVVKVRLYRPFSVVHFVRALPQSVRAIAVLDRTKEPGSGGEPLYKDVVTALAETAASDASPARAMPRVVGGRFGLSSKEFTPAMVHAVFEELKRERPKTSFTVGIEDDVTHTSLTVDPGFRVLAPEVRQAIFYGLGSDGTVGANKNTIKIIGERTDLDAQGYFVYDSKKAGAMTVSHLRFGPGPIEAPYLIEEADFVACHQPVFLESFDILEKAKRGATLLLNSPLAPEGVFASLPRATQKRAIELGVRLWTIDAFRVARDNGMGARINTIMQTCFFAISGVLPREEGIAQIKSSIEKTYGAKGKRVVDQNLRAVDETINNLHQVALADRVGASASELRDPVPADVPAFVDIVTRDLIAGHGDLLPVSVMPVDGTFPTGTAAYEKRRLAQEIPVWDSEICIQCGKCAIVCPHSAIRIKAYAKGALDGGDGRAAAAKNAPPPPAFKWTPAEGKEHESGTILTIQTAPEDCTGCGLCVEICPVRSKSEARHKALNLEPLTDSLLAQERTSYDYFLALPEHERSTVKVGTVRGSMLLQPLFEYSGACVGCGETPYVRLLSQLFGDRLVIANATGCSSIYGGNLPTTPWTTNPDGRGPAWANSLFEDNAEFGLGFRVSLDTQAEVAHGLLGELARAGAVAEDLSRAIASADQSDEAGIHEQRERVARLKERLAKIAAGSEANAVATSAPGVDSTTVSTAALATRLLPLADILVRKSVWLVGGDGWAYDIGFGGLDHVLASGRNVKILILDTEVYSNTGGQASKATPRGAVAKFASAGCRTAKKDIGQIAMSYGNVYVGQIAMGSNDTQTLRAFLEAESYDGPAILIAYSHCIAHGIDMRKGLEQQKLAVQAGHWPLFRYDPRRRAVGENPFQLDSKAPSIPLQEYAYREVRYSMLTRTHPEAAKMLLGEAQEDIRARWRRYSHLAGLADDARAATPPPATTTAGPAASPPASAAAGPAAGPAAASPEPIAKEG